MQSVNKYGKKLECWYTTHGDYDAPELPGRLCGVTESGKRVVTSRIVKAVGRTVRTESGSEYELGEADPEFVAYLNSNDYQFDPENPIRTVSRITHLPSQKPKPSPNLN